MRDERHDDANTQARRLAGPLLHSKLSVLWSTPQPPCLLLRLVRPRLPSTSRRSYPGHLPPCTQRPRDHVLLFANIYSPPQPNPSLPSHSSPKISQAQNDFPRPTRCISRTLTFSLNL